MKSKIISELDQRFSDLAKMHTYQSEDGFYVGGKYEEGWQDALDYAEQAAKKVLENYDQNKYYWQLTALKSIPCSYFNLLKNNSELWCEIGSESGCIDEYETKFTVLEFKEICENLGIDFNAFEKVEIGGAKK
jgi:hypothetical protein